MPYAIEKKENQFAVVNKDTGKVMGLHATRAKAEAQMRALYANEPEANKSGARNSKRDKLTILTIRKQAQALIDLTMDLEPEAEDDTEPDADADDAGEMEANPDVQPTAEYLAGLVDKSPLKSTYAKSINAALNVDALAVKSLGGNQIRGYVALWGNEKSVDLDLEYFTRETDFWDTALKNSHYQPPLTWDHGQDGNFKANPQIGTITEFGDDDIGRWYVAKLDESNRYHKAIQALIKAGRLGTSSDSAPQYVERVKTGKATWLKTWPLFAAALTNQPCEPRMLTDGSPEFLKSLGISLPDAPDMARELLQYRTRVLHIKGA